MAVRGEQRPTEKKLEEEEGKQPTAEGEARLAARVPPVVSSHSSGYPQRAHQRYTRRRAESFPRAPHRLGCLGKSSSLDPLKWGHHHWTVRVVSPTRRLSGMRQHKFSVPSYTRK
ncbi:hypothetical protein EVAR_78596_1 [Eumeta japonica]|uniref:Uncharacterized protein n=1 Tax=Eumeta variegata TaxID=151549 RepID=A0A4C1U8I7_EUMVA|nr:hypothetical protein EVAR_78596_1 [Eumeta japonica]